MERRLYDDLMASRLTRRTDVSNLAALLMVRGRMRKRAQAAREILQSRKEPIRVAGFSTATTCSGSDTEGQGPVLPIKQYNNSGPSSPSAGVEESSGTTLLAQRLAFLNLRSVLSDEDGNCQFRSLARELYGKQSHHAVVRQVVCEWIRDHSEDFSPYLAEEFDDYLKIMRKNRTWGDELTLRAAADAYGVRIYIISTERDNYLLEYAPEK